MNRVHEATGKHEGNEIPPEVTSKQQNPSSSCHPIRISHLDHLVLTVKDINQTVEFYTNVLGMELIIFNGGRKAVRFGNQKINLHEHHKEIEPKAATPTPGSADLCFIASSDLDQVIEHIKACKVEIIEGPVQRTGAVGPMSSVYIRDPDGNLVEISNYAKPAAHLK